jgi:hypothetical protein
MASSNVAAIDPDYLLVSWSPGLLASWSPGLL